MEVTPRSRVMARSQHFIFVVLLLTIVGLLGWLSQRYSYHMDWTASGRNTLSEASQTLLDRLPGEIRITAYAREDELLREGIAELIGRYQRFKGDIELKFVNPDTVPERVRQLGVTVDGELIIEYRGQTEHLQEHSEQALTNALQRVGRAGERWLAYLTGHGERDLLGQANHDLGAWGQHLERRGFQVQALNLAEAEGVPDNTSVLIIAGPRVPLLPGEVNLVKAYVEDGGNLLWLSDPDTRKSLAPLAEQLGIEFLDGVIVDPTTRLFGIDQPAFALVTTYAPHPATQRFDLLTLFPFASGISLNVLEPWEGEGILKTGGRVWSETGALEGEVRFDEATDLAGPFDIGVALKRPRSADSESESTPANKSSPADADPPQEGEQRAVVIGDGDFLSNAYLGNGGNLDLGLNLINWLSSDDVFIAIPSKTAPDLSLQLSRGMQGAIGIGSLFGVPLILLGSGFAIWLRRRKR